jgi:tellurite resistance protein TehA-like permease
VYHCWEKGVVTDGMRFLTMWWLADFIDALVFSFERPCSIIHGHPEHLSHPAWSLVNVPVVLTAVHYRFYTSFHGRISSPHTTL